MIVPGACFIPKASGDPYWGQVVLLMHMDATPFIDEKTHAITAYGSPTLDTTNEKYGIGCLAYLSNSGTSTLETAASSDFYLTKDDKYTVEVWAKHENSYGSTAGRQLIQSSVSGNFPAIYADAVYAGPYPGTELVRVTFSDCGYSSSAILTAVTARQWNHYAVVRESSTLAKCYLNGTLVHSFTSIGIESGTGTKKVQVGGRNDTVNSFYGYIDDVRVTKGVARYTANFTPPTAPFPNS